MTAPLTTDICVIGAGAAGLSVAAGAAQMGARVVLIEEGAMGGDCLNVGCVPSKALLAAAARAAQGGERLGVTLGPADVDFAAVMAHVRGAIAAIAPHDSQERFESLGVTVLRARACFTGPRDLMAGDRPVRAKRFVIATGTYPWVPPLPGLSREPGQQSAPYLTNESIFSLNERPAHLLVMGGGPVGVELAQAFRRLGSEVTLVQRSRILPRADEDAAALMRTQLLDEGMRLLEGASVLAVEGCGGDVRLRVEEAGGIRDVAGSHLLVATGRAPQIEALDLAKAGVAKWPKGIVVNRHLRTSNRRIYAVGDVTGRHLFTHMASHDAGVVLRNMLFRLKAKADGVPVPWVMFGDPEVAQVGLTEAEAEEAGLSPHVLRRDFAQNDRAQCEGDTRGFIKLVTGRGGRILGASCVGARAGEVIHPYCLAMQAGLGLRQMADHVVPYPMRSELGKHVAGQFYEPLLRRPAVRSLARSLLKLP